MRKTSLSESHFTRFGVLLNRGTTLHRDFPLPSANEYAEQIAIMPVHGSGLAWLKLNQVSGYTVVVKYFFSKPISICGSRRRRLRSHGECRQDDSQESDLHQPTFAARQTEAGRCNMPGMIAQA